MNFIDIDLKNNICSDEYVVGYQGESYVKGIRFILPDELVNWNAFVDLENANGDKTRYEIIDKDNNVISYEFTAVDLKYSGKLTLNLVLVKDKQILKPYIAEFIVKEAICAENESSENVPIILSSNLSNEINKNIESRHEHSNIDVLDKLDESDNGNLIYNGNPIISGSIPVADIPKKTSQLENDSGFVTEGDLPTKISQFENDSGFITSDDLPEPELPAVATDDIGKILKVVSVNEDGTFTCEWAEGAVNDVQINGASVVSDGKANIPIADTYYKYGLVKTFYGKGIGSTSDGTIYPYNQKSYIDERYSTPPITNQLLDYAVKSAMCDGKGAAWTEAEQAAARGRLGIDEWKLIREFDFPNVETDTSDILWYTDDSGNLTGFYITTDNEGNTFNYSDIRIEIQNHVSSSVDGYFRLGSSPTKYISSYRANSGGYSWLLHTRRFGNYMSPIIEYNTQYNSNRNLISFYGNSKMSVIDAIDFDGIFVKKENAYFSSFDKIRIFGRR